MPHYERMKMVKTKTSHYIYNDRLTETGHNACRTRHFIGRQRDAATACFLTNHKGKIFAQESKIHTTQVQKYCKKYQQMHTVAGEQAIIS